MAARSDEELWRSARDGDREAFAQIVERYQTLICSVAYSTCGDVAGSEDLAQETFLAAWQHLGDLRNPEGLRAWLCGIARNLSANSARRYQRRGGAPESLELVEGRPSAERDPAVVSVEREEEALVWRSLEHLPEAYREPLVLFYREDESVAEVARLLGLSEATVRQRLSRGRMMLREGLAGTVERILNRTRPGAGFTPAVLAGLGAVSTEGAGAAAAWVKASGLKGLLAKVGWGTWGGPAAGMWISWLAARALQRRARSAPERRLLTRHAWLAVLWTVGMCGVLVGGLRHAGTVYPATRLGITLGVLAWTTLLVVGHHAIGTRMNRGIARLREPEALSGSGPSHAAGE